MCSAWRDRDKGAGCAREELALLRRDSESALCCELGAARAPSPPGLNQGQHLPAPDVTGQAGMESPHVPSHVPSRPCSAAGIGLWGQGLLPHLFFWESIPQESPQL